VTYHPKFETFFDMGYRGYMNRLTYSLIVKDDNPSLREKSEPLRLPLSQKYQALAKRMLRYVKDYP